MARFTPPTVRVLELARDNAELELRLEQYQKQNRELLLVLEDAAQGNPGVARLIELEQALWAFLDLLTQQTPREGPSIYESRNPYSRPQVKNARRLLGDDE